MAKKEEVKQKPVAAPIVQSSPKYLIDKMADIYMMPKAEFWKAVKSLLPKEASESDAYGFLITCQQYSLNPFTGQIFCISTKAGYKPVVSVDGWSRIVNNQPAFDGFSFQDNLDDASNLISITCKINRKDRSTPTEATEYLAECKRDTDPWKKWPRRMLRHKAFIQAARYAFGLSGIYDVDEADRIREGEIVADYTVVDAATEEKKSSLKKRLKAATKEPPPVEEKIEPEAEITKEEPLPEKELEKVEEQLAEEEKAEPPKNYPAKQEMLDKIWEIVTTRAFMKSMGCTTADEMLSDLEVAPTFKELKGWKESKIQEAYDTIMAAAKSMELEI